MDVVIEFAKILIPAGLVLYAMFLVVKSFLNKEFNEKMVDIKINNTKIVLPIRLQAYERMCLFLERMAPNSLIPRLNVGELSSSEFHAVLLNEIREEYNHNVSQQVYMSEEAWEMVKNAKEDLIVTINNAASELLEENGSLELSRKIFEIYMNKDPDPIVTALNFIKNEIKESF